jgi:hypothetical protein
LYYLREFEAICKKGLRWDCLRKKNQSSKISWHFPFKIQTSWFRYLFKFFFNILLQNQYSIQENVKVVVDSGCKFTFIHSWQYSSIRILTRSDGSGSGTRSLKSHESLIILYSRKEEYKYANKEHVNNFKNLNKKMGEGGMGTLVKLNWENLNLMPPLPSHLERKQSALTHNCKSLHACKTRKL